MIEKDIEQALITKLDELKYTYRSDIRDRAALEQNFREKFEVLNRVHLTDNEFSRLLEQIITPDVFIAARTLRERNSFDRDDGTPLFYTLVNIKDWCKNTFEVVNQLRINTDNSHHRYDVMLLINGVPVVQIELKSLAISPRRAMQQIVDYKNDPGNGYTKTLLCFVQLFIVSNRSDETKPQHLSPIAAHCVAATLYPPRQRCCTITSASTPRRVMIVERAFAVLAPCTPHAVQTTSTRCWLHSTKAATYAVLVEGTVMRTNVSCLITQRSN